MITRLRMESDDIPLSDYDFLAGATLLVDKPRGWTSFDVVSKLRGRLRKLLGVRKIKVGHSGTLDPLATGLLIICTGKATKTLSGLQNLDKEYTGLITLGASTPSYDAETEVEEEFPVDHITEADLERVRLAFTGPQSQVPPMFSAIKVDGQPLYKKARKGEKMAIEPRQVIIHELEWLSVDLPEVRFRVRCSKGTYIRSLAHDIGKALESGGYLSELRRTKIGPYRIEEAWTLDELLAQIEARRSVSNPE